MLTALNQFAAAVATCGGGAARCGSV